MSHKYIYVHAGLQRISHNDTWSWWNRARRVRTKERGRKRSGHRKKKQVGSVCPSVCPFIHPSVRLFVSSSTGKCLSNRSENALKGAGEEMERTREGKCALFPTSSFSVHSRRERMRNNELDWFAIYVFFLSSLLFPPSRSLFRARLLRARKYNRDRDSRSQKLITQNAFNSNELSSFDLKEIRCKLHFCSRKRLCFSRKPCSSMLRELY